jgi:uncharacterized protein
MDVCPLCKGPRKSAKHNPTYPFCSGRCKLADLSNWMNGSYALDGEPAPQQDEEPSGDPTLH